MIGLSDFVNKKAVTCDAHTHLFDGSQSCPDLLLPESKLTVAFADIKFSDPESYAYGVTAAAYDRFITKQYPKIKDKVILLATAPSADEAIEIYENHEDDIKGFGEFKCYGWSESQETELPFGNLRWLQPVLEYDLSKKLPMYIHYDMLSDKRAKELENLLKKYPGIPVVLCHCGMFRCIDNYGAIEVVSRLMKEYPDLWTDISFEALGLFASDKNAIKKLPEDRVLIGSDLNPVLKSWPPPQERRTTVDSIVRNMEVVNGYGIDFYGNLLRLFNIQKSLP